MRPDVANVANDGIVRIKTNAVVVVKWKGEQMKAGQAPEIATSTGTVAIAIEMPDAGTAIVGFKDRPRGDSKSKR